MIVAAGEQGWRSTFSPDREVTAHRAGALEEKAARPYIGELDLVRALAILGVLIVHASADFAVGLAGQSRLYPFYVLLNRFSKVGTTTFIFLSSVVLFYSYGRAPKVKSILARFYRRRFLLILLPYLIWTVFYYVHRDYVQRPAIPWTTWAGWQTFWTNLDWSTFPSDLLHGTAYYHLYFVIINLQFYVLFPLLLFAFRQKLAAGLGAFFLGVVLQWATYGTDHFLLTFTEYLSFYGLGMAVAADPVGFFHRLQQPWRRAWPSLTKISLINGAWLAAGVTYAALYGLLWAGGPTYHSAVYKVAWNLYTLLSCVVLYYLGFVLYRRLPTPVLRGWLAFGRAAFGIYLVHPIILYFWQEKHPFTGSPLLVVAVGTFIIACGSWFVVAAAHRWLPRLARAVFGASNPRLRETPPRAAEAG